MEKCISLKMLCAQPHPILTIPNDGPLRRPQKTNYGPNKDKLEQPQTVGAIIYAH